MSMSLSEILERARAAVGWAKLRALEQHVVLSGPSDRYGVAGRVTLTFSTHGEFVDRFEGGIGTTAAFDGRVGWGLDMSGMPMPLDLDDLETPRTVYGVLSGRWLDEDGSFHVELDPSRADDRCVGLRIRIKDGVMDALLLLDRATWLPARLERRFVGWERSWEFVDHRTEGGFTLPRKLICSQEGLAEIDRFETLALLPGDAASPYAPVTTEPKDSRFDPAVSPRLALRKIASGHVFVRPRISGRDVGWFVFDTGSGAGFALLASVADEIGLPRFGRAVGGGAGSAVQVSAFRQGKTFQLGPMTISDSIYAELPQDLNVTMKRLADIDVVGTCGYDLFRRCLVELDLARAEAIFHPRDGGPTPGAWFDLKLQHRIPSLHCRFEGGHEGLFQIDTGAGPLILFHSPAVDRMHLLEGRETKPVAVQGASGSVDSMVGKVSWIDIAGQRKTDVRAMFVTGKSGALADPHTLGTFGGILLAPKKLVFDYGRRRMAVID